MRGRRAFGHRAPAAAGAIACLALCAGLLAPVARAQEAPTPARARIVYGDGRPEEQVSILESGPRAWISARDISAIIGAPRYWRSDLKRLVLKSGTHQMTFVIDSDIAVLDRTSPLHLAAPVSQQGDVIWLPIEILLDGTQSAMGLNGLDGARPWFDLPVRWNAVERRMDVGEPGSRLMGLVLPPAAPDRLDIMVEGAWEWRLAAADRDRMVLRLVGVSAGGDSARVPTGSRRFLDLRVTPIPEGVEVSFTPAPEAVGYRIQRFDRPGRLSLIVSTDAAEMAAGRLTPLPQMTVTDMPLFGEGTYQPDGIDTIVLDPAGGGGAGIRAKGISESQAMLDLARGVARRLTEELGLTVHLTRDADRALPDDERTGLANSVGADLFISLHCDAHPSPAVAGPRAVVGRPGSVPRAAVPGALRDLGFTAWGEAQRDQLPRSYRLADRLVTELAEELNIPSRGVEEWPLPLLSGAAMPAVYLEVATVTAPGGETRLARQQDAMIAAIVRAVDRYRREAP